MLYIYEKILTLDRQCISSTTYSINALIKTVYVSILNKI